VVSGAWLLLVAPQSSDLLTQLLRTLLITAGEGDGQGEFKFFQLVLTFSRMGNRT